MSSENPEYMFPDQKHVGVNKNSTILCFLCHLCSVFGSFIKQIL